MMSGTQAGTSPKGTQTSSKLEKAIARHSQAVGLKIPPTELFELTALESKVEDAIASLKLKKDQVGNSLRDHPFSPNGYIHPDVRAHRRARQEKLYKVSDWLENLPLGGAIVSLMGLVSKAPLLNRYLKERYTGDFQKQDEDTTRWRAFVKGQDRFISATTPFVRILKTAIKLWEIADEFEGKINKDGLAGAQFGFTGRITENAYDAINTAEKIVDKLSDHQKSFDLGDHFISKRDLHFFDFSARLLLGGAREIFRSPESTERKNQIELQTEGVRRFGRLTLSVSRALCARIEKQVQTLNYIETEAGRSLGIKNWLC